MCMRVLYVQMVSSPHSPVDGSTMSMMHLIKSFPPGEVQARVLCPPGKVAEFLQKNGVDWSAIPSVSLLQSTAGIPIRGARRLDVLRALWDTRHGGVIRRIVSEWRPDLVHLNERGMLHAARAVDQIGVPVVMHARQVADPTNSVVHSRSIQWINRHVARTIAIDESVRSSLRGIQRCEVVYNPLPESLLSSPGPERPGALRNGTGDEMNVTYLATLSTVKGVWDLLEAADRLRNHRGIRFSLVGGNSRSAAFHKSLIGRVARVLGLASDTERKLTEAIGIRRLENIRLLGRVSDIQTVLAGTDLLVFPSHLNGPGRAVFEAGVMGIPSIVAMKDKVEDVVQHGVTGLIVPERNPVELAAAIQRLADDPSLRVRMGAAARERYVRQFDPRCAAEAVLGIYRQIVTARSQRAVDQQ